MNIEKYESFFKNVAKRYKEDEVAALGAQLTYYLILSFFPFLIFLITLISYTPLTHEESIKTLEHLMPPQTYGLVVEMRRQVMSSDRRTILSFGMIATLWTASRGVCALIKGINKAYDQEETRPFWKLNGISILFTLGIALVILFSFVLLVLGKVLGEYLFNMLGITKLFKTAWDFIRYFTPLLSMTIVFVSVYYYIPGKRLKLKQVLPGSAFAVIGWVLLSVVFSFYINNFSIYTTTYGSIAGIIILLLWLYWCSIIILIGAEINATLAFDRIIKFKHHR
ncbi:MAG: YihY/virulence factor BrkB family protein [Acetivibrionales bacterium]